MLFFKKVTTLFRAFKEARSFFCYFILFFLFINHMNMSAVNPRRYSFLFEIEIPVATHYFEIGVGVPQPRDAFPTSLHAHNLRSGEKKETKTRHQSSGTQVSLRLLM